MRSKRGKRRASPLWAPVLAGMAGLVLGGPGGARAELGNDLLDDVSQPRLLDVDRFAGSMPDDAGVQLGVETSQKKVLHVAPELENGTDVGFGFEKINSLLLGKAGVILGDVTGGEADVRGGFYVGNKKGVVIFGWQLGEPDRIKRSKDEVVVSQSRDVAVFVNVSAGGDPAIFETDIAIVRKCSVKTTFKDKNGDHSDEDLPDSGSWKVECSKGWNKALEGLSDEGRAAINKVLGGKKFANKGKGDWLDIDQALENFDIPIFGAD